jgi:Cu/Ag efflux pump CusA
MMRRVVSASLRFRYLVVALAVGMVLVGAAQLRDVPVDVFPEFAPPRVQIQTPALGMSAAEVESLVTTPMEQALSGVEGLDILRSKSAPQVSAI